MRFKKSLLWICASLGLGACVSVVAVDGERYRITSDAFRGYLEAVFRAQNKTADELAFALEDLAAERTAAIAELTTAETQLLTACAEVNRLAVTRRDGAALKRREALSAARTAPDCERAERAARAALAARD